MRPGLSLLAAIISTALISGCFTPQRSRLEHVLAGASNKAEGSLVIESSVYHKQQQNMGEEKWDAFITIRNNALISSDCVILLRVYNNKGKMLDEYLIFTDTLAYESTVTHHDEMYIKNEHLDHISFAKYDFNCIKKDILGR